MIYALMIYCLGHHKKDLMCEAMKAVQKGDYAGLQYLARAIEIFMAWKKSGFSGLTSATFTACIQTMGAVPELAAHLMKKHGFSYVLSDKFMSGPIKGRFGWYRQVNGGNFYMSVKQVLQAEKK